jgi:DNA-binding response OmpR family regulator
MPVSAPATGDQKPLILVVEDHEDLRAFIREALVPFYQVVEAPDGLAGLQIARSTIPDIIISDVMMPRMDGTQLCALLKQDELTSHIPLILLTAKASQDSRIEGLQTGADVYLSKPFNEGELLLHLKNLFYLRQKMLMRFVTNKPVPVAEAVESPMDKVFLERLTAIILANISDENFSVEEMVNQIGMSRTQLHRKVKAVTGQSAGYLIRLIRLQQALELLQQSEFTIAEIAYQVGFTSPSYFTESFQKHFGYLPTNVRKKVS